MANYQVVGQSHPRHDVLEQITGTSIYVDDITRPGMLYAKALRSKYAHARLLNIDTQRAEKLPGVKGVITHRNVPHNRYGVTHQDQPVLADDKVRYYGDAVAVVAAESLETAEEALSLISVEYEPLKGVFDVHEAMQEESTKIHGDSNIAKHLKIRNGDIEKGLAEADHIIEETITTQMVEHAPIETHAAIAEISNKGELILHALVSRPFTIASDLEKIVKVPMNRIRVICGAIGGGFGGKNEITCEHFVALLALQTQRPVKMVYTREEEFETSTVRHPYITKYRTGVKKDGTLVAREVEIISDCGAYVSWGASTLSKACIHGCGPYRIPHVAIDGYLVYTNKPVGGAMRGFGVPQVGFAYEAHMDTVAAELGISPIELRMKSLIDDNCELPTGQVLPVVTSRETFMKALKLFEERRGIKL